MNTLDKRLSVLFFSLILAAGSVSASVNKNIKIDSGETSDGDSSVNGNIRVGSSATVTGKLSTVNGGIKIEDGASLRVVESVNGRIDIGDDVTLESSSTVNGRNSIGKRARISDNVETVNGAISIEEGGTVGGNISAVNGKLELTAVTVQGDLVNVNGGMELLAGTRVAGALIVKKPKRSGWSFGKRKRPRIVIGENVVIEGGLELEQPVTLLVHESADVGEIRGVDVDMEMYSGGNP